MNEILGEAQTVDYYYVRDSSSRYQRTTDINLLKKRFGTIK